MENMDHNAHSVYLMYYHLIMVVKYRRKVINCPISERAKEIREKLWKEAFWSQSFCLLTAGGAPAEVIRQYIETQGEKKIEHSISFPDLSNRRTEDTPWKNIWLLSFFVQPDA